MTLLRERRSLRSFGRMPFGAMGLSIVTTRSQSRPRCHETPVYGARIWLVEQIKRG
jgi:hypothetical protein